MALEITEQVEIAFQDADKADQRLDEFLVRDRMVRILHDLGEFTQEQRRGNFALISALEFQPRRMYGEPIWDMYWQPLSSATDTSGKDHFFPDVSIVDADTVDQWCFRHRSLPCCCSLPQRQRIGWHAHEIWPSRSPSRLR